MHINTDNECKCSFNGSRVIVTKEHEILLISAQYRLDYTIMKQPGECPSSDKWSPATGHSATTRHNDHRHYDCNYCHHRHHQHHHHYHYHQKQHRHHYQQQHHHHCHSNHYHQYVTNVHRSKDKTLRDDRYRSSFQFSVIFLNVLSCNQGDNDDDANADADDDGDNDADAKHDSDEVFLTENISRFTVPGISFASSYVW